MTREERLEMEAELYRLECEMEDTDPADYRYAELHDQWRMMDFELYHS